VAVAGAVGGLAPLFLLALVAPAGLLARQVSGLVISDPAACLALFKLNTATGGAVALALLAGRL